MKSKTDDTGPTSLHSLNMLDSEWDDVVDVARYESKRLKRHVSASEIIRQGSAREVKRINKRRSRG